MKNEWEVKYEDLLRLYRQRGNELDKLNKDLNNERNKKESAEFKIRTELEPRIKQEEKSYDSYVVNGGSDECMQNGMSGKCGEDCSVFGSKDECYETINKEDIIPLHEDGHDMDIGIDIYNLERQAFKVDLRILNEKLKSMKKKRFSLIKDILFFRKKDSK